MKITKNLMIPQDLTIFTHHEDNKVHHANVKGAFATIGSKTNLQHLKTLNKYINAKNSHSTMVLSNHDVIKSIFYMKILQVYTHTTKVLAPSETKISKPKKIQTKIGTNPALSLHHYHMLPLKCVSNIFMESWWKNHLLTMIINQGIEPSNKSKCTSWAPQKKPNNRMILNQEDIPP